ncbi:MAG: hypothetical protein QOG91_149 [Candidatus Parcubacteria bacterium]|jgi:asparagine synthase (glutamine-hydrolysing)|nr:hypothetical protein [Candidatus Parcubacteria bacterium]
MCGISGYSGRGDAAILRKMNETLRHRGPDDAGERIWNTTGFAFRRLAIIDLSVAGHQPMSNEDGTVWVIFNGEIYNFAELKDMLVKRHSFKSATDTEVIIHLYEEIGTEVFSKIQGMFAIALYDTKKDRLILARDRLGKKPLYWGIHDGTFLFGSELKSLMAHPSFSKELDLESLNKYFLYEYVPTPRSIFKNVSKLEAGTFLIWNGREAAKEAYWKPTFMPKESSFADSLVKLDRSLEAAVADRLVADVPLGIFLSGGIDSSAVAYYAVKANRGPVKTFSIGFEEPSFDESGYARRAARALCTEHHEKILSVKDCLELIPEIGERLDEPMADASLVPTYLLSKFTREHVTVALGGDGGDELFCGYDTFLAHRLAGLYGKIPAFIRTAIIERAALAMPTSHSNMSLDFRIKKFVSGFEGDRDFRNQRWLGAFDRKERQALFSAAVSDAVSRQNEFDDIERLIRGSDSRDFYDRLGLVYERMYMMDDILVKVDRASMMNSLEVRAPFLDTRVVDLANRMPTWFKFRGLERKYILKKLMEDKLPRDIIYRKKKGFGMPVAEWLRGGLKPLLLDVLGRESLGRMGLFSSGYVGQLLDKHFSGSKDNRKQIWTLFMFALWWRKWMA